MITFHRKPKIVAWLLAIELNNMYFNLFILLFAYLIYTTFYSHWVIDGIVFFSLLVRTACLNTAESSFKYMRTFDTRDQFLFAVSIAYRTYVFTCATLTSSKSEISFRLCKLSRVIWCTYFSQFSLFSSLFIGNLSDSMSIFAIIFNPSTAHRQNNKICINLLTCMFDFS